jgi:poly(3-hydroxybutyrate) depolymerase
MKIGRYLVVAAVAGAFGAAGAWSQALTSLQSVRVGYNTRKATVRPTGELKDQIDAIDKEIAVATQQGKNAEVRRLMAKGTTLLAGRPWTDVLDFSNSLVVRTEHVIADSSQPLDVRLEQIYTPSIQLTRSLTAHVMVQKRPAAAPTAGQPPAAPETIKDLGKFDGVGRDLRESPYRMTLDVHDVADGTYQLAIEVLDDTRPLGTSTLAMNFRKGLDQIVSDLEAAAKQAPGDTRDDIIFPVDRMRNVNRGRLELRTFDPDKDFAAAQAVAQAVKSGTNPYEKKTGDFKRHYLLESASEIMPYHLYVPSTYDGSSAFPLIIALHGLGGTEDSFFDGYNRSVVGLAETHGYIVAAPLGYRVDGGYGWGVGNPPADPVSRRSQQTSEDDVMQVLQNVRRLYRVDGQRIYLMGHSLGAIGTWKIAPRFPEVWAAIGLFAGSGNAESLARIRTLPEIVVHGDDDRTVNVQGSRTMVAKMKELGIEHKYIEVPGGTHGGVVAPNLPAVFDFFDAHKK